MNEVLNDIEQKSIEVIETKFNSVEEKQAFLGSIKNPDKKGSVTEWITNITYAKVKVQLDNNGYKVLVKNLKYIAQNTYKKIFANISY